ncbi:MAG: hypothetical protein HDR53_01410 [Treponema sp.]|nr:hypothetical protein [Treponema sp.]
MIKAPHKWRGTFIMTSFRWKLAYQMPLLISLRSGRENIYENQCAFWNLNGCFCFGCLYRL